MSHWHWRMAGGAFSRIGLRYYVLGSHRWTRRWSGRPWLIIAAMATQERLPHYSDSSLAQLRTGSRPPNRSFYLSVFLSLCPSRSSVFAERECTTTL